MRVLPKDVNMGIVKEIFNFGKEEKIAFLPHMKKRNTSKAEKTVRKSSEFYLKLDIALQEQTERFKRLHKDQLARKARKIAESKLIRKIEIPLTQNAMYNLGQIEKYPISVKRTGKFQKNVNYGLKKNKNTESKAESLMINLPMDSIKKLGLSEEFHSHNIKSKRDLTERNSSVPRQNYTKNISQNDLDRVLKSIQLQASQDSFLNSTIINDDIKSEEKEGKINWNSLREENQLLHDQKVLQSLVDQGIVSIDKGEDKPHEKVDKSILDFKGENQDFYKFYLKKYNLNMNKLNPFMDIKEESMAKLTNKKRKGNKLKYRRRSQNKSMQYNYPKNNYLKPTMNLKEKLNSNQKEKSLDLQSINTKIYKDKILSLERMTKSTKTQKVKDKSFSLIKEALGDPALK
mmetsp:Transcript_24860/g.22063  ORF Transcript_24860/g.22063 Transcript_24860/m.22063 type:complete len:403 (+) Transcript_24860:150-1358(+)